MGRVITREKNFSAKRKKGISQTRYHKANDGSTCVHLAALEGRKVTGVMVDG